MKTILIVALLASSALAADQSIAAAESACGPANIQFDVNTESNQHPAAMTQDGKALVYVVEVFEAPGNQLAKPTTKIGLDGTWIGANKNNSYFSVAVEPGEHHLCMAWQSRLKGYAKKIALSRFSAETGKTYYFRARIVEHDDGLGAWFTLDLEPVNNDEGKLLIASSAFGNFHPKN